MEFQDRLSEIRTKLILGSPFFGTLSMQLKIEESTEVETFSTDGTTLKINPGFADKLNFPEMLTLLAKPSMHCGLRHPYRMGIRDEKTWHEACSYVIDQDLVDAGFIFPAGTAKINAKYKNMPAEQIYSILMVEQQNQQSQSSQPGKDGKGSANGQGDASGKSFGGFEKPKTPDQAKTADGKSEHQNTEIDWTIATEQATSISKKAGKIPSSFEQHIKALREPETNWRDILSEFIEQLIPSDYSWASPNRRYLSMDLYLPGVIKDTVGTIAIGVDTSGSINKLLLDTFASELTHLHNTVKPSKIVVFFCDTKVHNTVEFTQDDDAVILKTKSGGGTRFQPVFDAVAQLDEQPKALVYLTDLYGPAPVEPEYPVLWVTSKKSNIMPPFGQVIRIDEYAA